MLRVRLLDPAPSELARLDKPVARRIVQRIRWLAANFSSIKPEPLTGDLAGLYKLRVGDYRVVYRLRHEDQTLVIHGIGHRREIYRKR